MNPTATLKIALLLLVVIFISRLEASDPGSKKTEEKLDRIVETVEFVDAGIIDVLRLLAEQNGLNLIIGPDSMGVVSLRFSGVTLRAALDAILQTKGFQYTLYDNILVVSAPDSLERLRGLGLETEIVRLKYADAAGVKAMIDSAKVMSPWGYTTVYARSIKTDVLRATQAMSGDANPAGDIPVPARSDILIITDRPNNIRIVKDLINSIDVPVRQIQIDVFFVETILDENNQLGIDWQSVLSVQGNYRGKTDWIFGNSAGSIIELGSLSQSQFKAVLDMMVTENRANLLSQPRITTLDNQPASISIGVTTWIEERTAGGGGVTGEVQIRYNERQVPIELVVVPHIIHNDKILLELQPRVEEITGWQEGAQGQQLPIISTRRADSRVEIGNGETAIIGGLIKETMLLKDKKVWLLSSIPLLGNLFKQRTEQKLRTDLSIFITPHIVEEKKKDDHPGITKKEIPKEIDAPEKIGTSKPQSYSMMEYFPFKDGSNWNYAWTDTDGRSWETAMKLSDPGEKARSKSERKSWLMSESIYDGRANGKARSGYYWSKNGLYNEYRANMGGDSISYKPARLVMPVNMQTNKRYRSTYNWKTHNQAGGISSEGRVEQVQRFLGEYNITTKVGRFQKCAAIETIWFDKDDPTAKKQRKVVWYALDVGPVKVENDISLGDESLKGKISALLSNR